MSEQSERKERRKMKKENKKNKNVMKTIKIITIILLIVLISMIGFFGIYKQNKNQMSNIVKDYTYAMDINGARTLKLTLNSENGDDVKTAENYETAKIIIEKRLKKLDVQEYKIGVNEETGEITVQIPENTQTDEIVSNLTTVGKFEIIDSQTNDVLLDNSSIKSSKVLYNTTSSGTSVYLEIAFDKNGKNKLEEISKTYVKSENNTTENTTSEDTNSIEENENNTEETNTTSENSTSTEKKITMKIDDDEIMSTSFDETITTGKIQLSVGQASTDSSTVQGYVKQAQNVATVLDSGKLPVKYDVEKNQYVLSNISKQDLIYVAIAMAVVAIMGIIVLIAKYKTNGLLAGISYIGLSALYLIAIRYTNVTISIDSIFAIGIILILNYIFTNMLLSNIRKMNDSKVENAVGKSVSETYKKFFMRIIPICVVVITFCFANWIPMNSFGMTAFWGIVIIAIYNAIITNGLLRIKNK
jgi:membrane protein